MDSNQPLFIEQHRSAIMTRTIAFVGWLLILMSIVVGIRDGASRWPDALLLFGIGAGFTVAHWFLTPKRYLIYQGQLIVAYGTPRERRIPYDSISGIQVVRHILGGELRISRKNGSQLYIQPWRPYRFLETLQTEIGKFNDNISSNHSTTVIDPVNNPEHGYPNPPEQRHKSY